MIENDTIVQRELYKLSEKYQNFLEEIVANYPTGTCYLSAHILTEYFIELGLKANVVVGNLALLNIKDKYAVYGHYNLKKSINVGDYHAWCELQLNGLSVIVDPSIKYNSHFLKNHHNFKTSKKIGDSIVTVENENYYWKYRENQNLKVHYDFFIEKASDRIIKIILEQLLINTPQDFLEKVRASNF